MRSKLITFAVCFASAFAAIGLALPGGTTAVPIAAADQASSTPAAAPPVEEHDVPFGHRLLYSMARDKAAELYAKQHKITEAAARAKLAKISDKTLHTAVKASKASTEGLPAGDRLEDILRWIVDHKDLIIAIAKILIELADLLSFDVPIEPHWFVWCVLDWKPFPVEHPDRELCFA